MSRDSFITDAAIVTSVGSVQDSQRSDRWISALAYSVAAASLSFAMVLPRGLATVAVAQALVLCVCGVLLPSIKTLEQYGDAPVAGALAVALVAHAGLLLTGIVTPATAFPLAAGLLLAGSGFAPVRWLGRAQVPLLLAVFVVYAGLALSESTRAPGPLDTGAAALLSGANPYLSGYHEMPVLLLLAVPAHLLGDVRFGLVLAIAGAGAFLASARPGRAGLIAASLLLFLPAQLGAIRDGGVEPFIILLLAATIFCTCRHPRALPWVLGLLLVSKTYLVLTVPVALVLSGLVLTWRGALHLAWKAVLVGSIVTAPFIAWNPGALISAVQSAPPPPSLHVPTLAGWLAAQGFALPAWAGLFIAAATAAFVVLYAARTASGFSAGLALTCLGLFAFSPEATVSQHALVLAALYIAVGATGLPGVMRDTAEMKSFYVRR